MKKGLTGLLCLVLAASSSVQAEGKVTYSISDDGVGFSVTYYDTDEFNKVTLMMLKDSELVYMSEKALESVADSITFDEFKLDAEKWLSGDYVIKVGANKNITSSDVIKFVNPNQKKTVFLKMINPSSSPNAESVNTLLGEFASFVDFGYESDYLPLSEKRREQICQSIVNLNLYQKYTENNDNTDDLIFEFCNYMKKIYEAAALMDAKSADDVIYKIDNAKTLQFDSTYFSNDADKNPYSKFVYDRRVIAQSIADHNFDIYDTINTDKINEVLNGNTLLYVINNNDYVTSERALNHFKNSDYMNIDFSSYDDLNSSEKAQVFSELKKAGIADYTEIPLRFKSITDKLASSGNKNNSGLSYGGSNRGGSSSGSVTTKPSDNDVPAIAPDKNVFFDIDDVAWAKEAITELKKHGVIDGVGGGMYEPHSAVSREALVKMIVLAYGMSVENAESNFSDVSKDSWSYPYVSSAFVSGLINGKSNGLFDAKSNISREDAAVIIYRAYTKKMGSVDSTESFTDESDISEYARQAVAAMKKLGIINGYDDGGFHPKQNVTRAECAKMIYAAYKLLS